MATKKPVSVKLQGSAKSAPKGSKKLTKADDAQTIEITLRLRPKVADAVLDRLALRISSKPPRKRQYLTREALEAKYGASHADVKKVEAFAHANKLTVTRVHVSSRVVRISGAVEDVRKAFGVNLKRQTVGTRTYRVRQGSISIPRNLQGIVIGVHGIDDRPVAKPHLRRKRKAAAGKTPGARSMTVAEIAKLYNFPAGLTGAGQCVAFIELNGTNHAGQVSDTGYAISDLKSFCARNKIAMPEIVSVGVDGGANIPGKPKGGDDEVTLDIEVAAGVAPGASFAVYFAPNTSAGFIDAIKAAVHDKQRKPSVVSISWGGAEDPQGHFSPQFMDGINEAIRDAAILGVTVCVAAGDDGAPDMERKGWDRKPHADFPASSPFALGCGGTQLIGSGTHIDSESVWNGGADDGAGGGGVSNYYARPAYQAKAGVPNSPKGKRGRGVPDVAGNADPASGYEMFFQGKVQTGKNAWGGTSAVAPLMAGLLALINEKLAKSSKNTAGFINPQIYGTGGPAAFRDIIKGDNDIYHDLGKYSASVGWDACTGLGVADGKKLRALLT
jgi:kumamolisin